MIFTDRKITIRNGKSSIDEPVILYRGDFEVSIRFTIMESKFKFKSGVNLVDSEKASFGQLAILAPYGGNVFSEIVKCEDGTVTFTLTKEMIDQLEEVGLYSFQIRLFDYYRESRVSIPPVEFGIEVREPVASEDHDNEVNNAIVGYSIAKVVDPSKEDVGDTFDDDGNYNKTDWETGDRISEGKLNKIEDALDKINQNEINDKNALNKQMTSNFNVLQNQVNSQLADKVNKGQVSVSDIDKNLGKFDQTYMTDEFLQQITGNASINATPKNYSISPEKTTFFDEIGRNLFNPNDSNIIVDGYYNSSNVLTTNVGNYQTGFIPVETNTDYTSNDTTGFVNWYDNEFTFIQSTPSATFLSQGYVTSPNSAGYARFVTSSQYWNKFQVEKGRVKTDYVAYSYPKISSNHLGVISKGKIDNLSIDLEDTTFCEKGKNLFNPNDNNVLLGIYYNNQNVLTTNGTFNQTGFIKVKTNTDYTSNDTARFVNWYDNEFTFIQSTPSATFLSQGYVTSPNSAGYARFVTTVSNWHNFQVEEGRVQTEYEGYKAPKISEDVLPDFKELSTLNGKSFTSYGDSITYQNMWQPYVVDYFNFKHTNLGIGSTTVTYLEDKEERYPSFTNEARISAIKESNPDIITILGGTNDCHYQAVIGDDSEFGKKLNEKDKATFKGAYSFLIETLLNWKPSLKIVLLTPMQTSYTYSYNKKYYDYAKAVKDIALYYAIPIIDTYSESNISYFNNAMYTKDGIHPNEEGGKNIANLVIDKFKSISHV